MKIKPCDARTNEEAKAVKKFRLEYKDEVGDTRIVEAGYASHVSENDNPDSSYFYFEIWESIKGEGEEQNIVLRSSEIDAFVKWWLGTK